MSTTVRRCARCHALARAGAWTAACLLFAALQWPAAAAAQDGAASYDGRWTGNAITDIGGGRCGQNWKFEGTVSGGVLTGTAVRAAEHYSLDGTFKSGGKIRWEVFGPGANAWGRGKVEGDVASGSWFDNRRTDCQGSFELRRGG